VDAPRDPDALVRLLGVPIRLWEQAAQHHAELIREFDLITLAGPHGHLEPPQELILEIQAHFFGLAEQPATLRSTDPADGAQTRDLEIAAGPEAADACRRLLARMEEADAYCSSGVLMTLPTPPDQKALREWYLGEFIRQGGGEPPTPWSGSGP
jgi:hypothetical protein